MKKVITSLLACTLLLQAAHLRAEDALTMGNDEMNAIYNTDAGAGCEDGVYKATSSSMVWWGMGIAAAAALLAGLLHQSSSSSHSSSQ